MTLSPVRLGFIFFVLLIQGCATAGNNFVLIPDDALVLGQTTEEDIKSRQGPPYREAKRIQNSEEVSYVSYTYAKQSPATDTGVVATRSQGFWIFKGKLAGYAFSSSWPNESTNFDGGKVPQIRKNQSSRSDVVRLLGRPSGRYVYPMIPSTSGEAIAYLYIESRYGERTASTKHLIVTFNKQDIVTDVSYMNNRKE